MNKDGKHWFYSVYDEEPVKRPTDDTKVSEKKPSSKRKTGTDYRKELQALYSKLYICFFFTFVIIFFPLVFLHEGDIYEKGIWVYIHTGITALGLIYFIARMIHLLLSIKRVNDSYYGLLPNFEYDLNRNASKGSTTLYLLLSLCTIMLFFLLFYSFGKVYLFERDYDIAVEYIEKERYYEAYDLLMDWFKELKTKNNEYIFQDYKDYQRLFWLCDAHMYYEKGNYESSGQVAGYTDISKVTSLSKQTYEREKEFVRLAKEMGKEQKLQKEIEEQILDNRIKYSYPFVGMPESKIDNSILGEHSSVRTESYKTGKKYYDWDRRCYKDVYKKRTIYSWSYHRRLVMGSHIYSKWKDIYVAICEDGIVIEVEDMLYNKEVVDKAFENFVPPVHHKDYDEYDVDEFSDPEDFYDWYSEDFDSYEDAEDYYYSHGGK